MDVLCAHQNIALKLPAPEKSHIIRKYGKSITFELLIRKYSKVKVMFKVAVKSHNDMGQRRNRLARTWNLSDPSHERA